MSDTNGYQPQEPETREVRLPAHALRRLSRLASAVEGAELAVQGAQQTAQSLRNDLQRRLGEACEDAGLDVPQGSPIQSVDWNTGLITIGALPQPLAAPAFQPVPAEVGET